MRGLEERPPQGEGLRDEGACICLAQAASTLISPASQIRLGRMSERFAFPSLADLTPLPVLNTISGGVVLLRSPDYIYGAGCNGKCSVRPHSAISHPLPTLVTTSTGSGFFPSLNDYLKHFERRISPPPFMLALCFYHQRSDRRVCLCLRK